MNYLFTIFQIYSFAQNTSHDHVHRNNNNNKIIKKQYKNK